MAPDLINVKVHLSWYLNLHSDTATRNGQVRRKAKLTIKVSEEQNVQRKDKHSSEWVSNSDDETSMAIGTS